MSLRMSNTSITHTFGNVACVAMDYIKSFFSEDFFKTVHISTKVAYRQLDVFRSKKEFWKLHKPMLILRPRIELDDSSKWFYNSTLANRVHNAHHGTEFAYAVELFKDRGKSDIRFIWNRLKIYYDVVIVVGTANTQLNIAHALNNMVVPNSPFYINTPLEGFIPKNIVYSACDIAGIDINDTAKVLDYMNSKSKTAITYKFKNGSGNNEFFAVYPTNIEAIISDISFDDGNDKGLVQDSFTISFTMACGFNCMSTFYCLTNDDNDIYVIDPIDNNEYLNSSNTTTVPIFTIPILNNFPLKPGWAIVNSPMYTVDKDLVLYDGYDKTDISPVFNSSLQQVIDHQLGMNMPLDLVVEFKLYKNKELMVDGLDYEIDINKKIIITKNCDSKATYRLFVLVNNAYIHSMSLEITKFNREF